jgi:hypothetical protein
MDDVRVFRTRFGHGRRIPDHDSSIRQPLLALTSVRTAVYGIPYGGIGIS